MRVLDYFWCELKWSTHYVFRLITVTVVLICVTVILEKTIRIPRSLSVKAAQVLKGFLNKVYNYTCTCGLVSLSHDH